MSCALMCDPQYTLLVGDAVIYDEVIYGDVSQAL